MAIAESEMPSAVHLSKASPDPSSSPNGAKRRLSDDSEQGDTSERKRKRIHRNVVATASPSPTRTNIDTAPTETETAQQVVSSEDHPAGDSNGYGAPRADEGPRPSRNRNGADEKQRSKRLFGALLGNLNQKGSETSKRRQEIEARRKAELRKQDEERAEKEIRKTEQAIEWRRRRQVDVDEDEVCGYITRLTCMVHEEYLVDRRCIADAHSSSKHARQSKLSGHHRRAPCGMLNASTLR